MSERKELTVSFIRYQFKDEETKSRILKERASMPYPRHNALGVANLLEDIEEMISEFQADSREEDLNIIHGLKNLIPKLDKESQERH